MPVCDTKSFFLYCFLLLVMWYKSNLEQFENLDVYLISISDTPELEVPTPGTQIANKHVYDIFVERSYVYPWKSKVLNSHKLFLINFVYGTKKLSPYHHNVLMNFIPLFHFLTYIQYGHFSFLFFKALNKQTLMITNECSPTSLTNVQ